MRFPPCVAILTFSSSASLTSVAVFYFCITYMDFHESASKIAPPRHLARLARWSQVQFVSRTRYFAVSTRGGGTAPPTHVSVAGIDRWNESRRLDREINRSCISDRLSFHESLRDEGSKRRKCYELISIIFFLSRSFQK